MELISVVSIGTVHHLFRYLYNLCTALVSVRNTIFRVGENMQVKVCDYKCVMFDDDYKATLVSRTAFSLYKLQGTLPFGVSLWQTSSHLQQSVALRNYQNKII